MDSKLGGITAFSTRRERKLSQERNAWYLYSCEKRGFSSVSRAGIAVTLVGAALISLSAVSAPASEDAPDEQGRILHGSNAQDVLSGGSGDDELYGDSGRDLLLSGHGSDFIEAKDGESDYVACGSGDDVADVDDVDLVASDCETVFSE